MGNGIREFRDSMSGKAASSHLHERDQERAPRAQLPAEVGTPAAVVEAAPERR